MKAPTCLNCGEKLLGDFCWRCGQEAADFHRPLRSLASDFLDNVLSLDSKLLRTVFALLLKLLYLRRGILYLDHLVFALHLHAFAFVVLTAAVLIAASGTLAVVGLTMLTFYRMGS